MKKIAIIGIRGIPVVYSGFESFAENLTTMLSDKFTFVVYCRNTYVGVSVKNFKGIKLVVLPSIPKKNLESIIHSTISTFHAIFITKPRIVYYLGVGNALFLPFARLFGLKTIINVDGLDWKREKWGIIAKIYLKFAEYLASKCADIVITDSKYIQNYYLKTYRKKTIYIPYMFNPDLLKLSIDAPNILKKYLLKKNKYFIWVGRIVPDNHLDELVDAFMKMHTNFKCVIVGSDLYHSKYEKKLLARIACDMRFIHTGFVKKEIYATLVHNAFCYVETKRSGGTHPSLVEAIGLANLIVSNDYLANKQILGRSAFYYKNHLGNVDLIRILKYVQNKNFTKNILLKCGKRPILKKNLNPDFVLDKYAKIFEI